MANLILLPLKRLTAKTLINTFYFLALNKHSNSVYKYLFHVAKSMVKALSMTPYEVIDTENYSLKCSKLERVQLTNNRVLYSSHVTYRNENTKPIILVSGPDVFLTIYNNIEIQGNSDFILDTKSNYAINDLCYNLSEAYGNSDGILWRQKRNLALLKYKHSNIRSIEKAIMLTGKFSENYYHVLYEILIKLTLVETTSIPNDVPLLIDESVSKVNTFKQILDILNFSKRQVIFIGKNEMLSVKSLYAFSAINRIPPHVMILRRIEVTDFYFDVSANLRLRSKLLELKSNRNFPSKFFISRKTSKNRKYNESEIIDLVENLGFVVISPEQYDLTDQISLFNQADFIIAASGAALSNILFCQKACKIICLQSRKLDLPIFSTLATILELEMRYLDGLPSGLINKNYLHSNYRIDINELKKMIYSIDK